MTAADPPAKPGSPYASALLSMIKGIADRGESEYGKAAESMEMLVGRGDVPVNLSYYATMYSALCYDIAGFQGRAERMYKKMDDVYNDELERIIPSRTHAKKLAKGLSMLGRREACAFSEALSDAIRWIKLVESETGEPLKHDRADDYTVMLSSMILLDDFFGALTGAGEGEATGRIAHAASEQCEELPSFDLSPQVGFMARLHLQLIRAASERAVAALGIGGDVKRGLIRNKKYELWPPQRRAVDAGLLDGQSVVCATPPGSGKSLLAHLALAGAGRGRGGIAAYLVPTKSLSRQVGREVESVFGDKMRLAVSNRDAAGDDDALRGLDLVVATYEKMDALLRRGKIGPEDVRTVIVDEVHGLGDGRRGVDLEMLLTRLRAAGPVDRQFVALSATASSGDAEGLAEWLAAKPVVDEWRPVDIDESICLDGWLYGRGGGEPARLPGTFAAKGGSGNPKKRLQACFAYARRALVDDGHVLVSVHKRSDAFSVAHGIKDMMERAVHLDPDLAGAMRRDRAEWEKAARSIEETDAEMPPHAAGLARLMRSGIAYHHAGLGSKYRAAVEDAAERGHVRAVVATSTLDAGINMPFRTVVFHNPLSRTRGGGPYLDAAKYRNIAGRAGRMGYSGAGESVLLAMSSSDAERMREGLWNSGGDVLLRSALSEALDGGQGWSDGKDGLLSHILEVICEGGGRGGAGDVVDRILSSWFCHSEPPDEARVSQIEACVRDGIGRLEGMGLVIASGGGAYAATPAGAGASGSMLLPASFSMIRGCIERLGRMGMDGADLEAAALIMAASPAEVLGRYERMADGVKAVPERLARLQLALGDPGGGGGARLAAILSSWAGSMPLAEIMGRFGIGEERAGDIEDGLAADAAWVLSTAAGMAREMEGCGGIAGALEAAAESCRYGTADPSARRLVEAGLPGMGRETAVRLAAHLRGRGGGVAGVSRSEITGLFAANPAGAERLWRSLEGSGRVGEAAASLASREPAAQDAIPAA